MRVCVCGCVCVCVCVCRLRWCACLLVRETQGSISFQAPKPYPFAGEPAALLAGGHDPGDQFNQRWGCQHDAARSLARRLLHVLRHPNVFGTAPRVVATRLNVIGNG